MFEEQEYSKGSKQTFVFLCVFPCSPLHPELLSPALSQDWLPASSINKHP